MSPLLGMNALQWFVDTSSMCALFSYILVVVSFILLKKNEPNLARPLNIRGGTRIGWIILMVVCLYFVLYLKENLFSHALDPEIVITLIWIAVGVVLTLITMRRRRTLRTGELELAVFGERFARKGEKYEN